MQSVFFDFILATGLLGSWSGWIICNSEYNGFSGVRTRACRCLSATGYEYRDNCPSNKRLNLLELNIVLETCKRFHLS